MSNTFYRSCFVPLCTNNTKNTPDKTFLYVPKDEKLRNKWFRAVHRENPKSKSIFLCCEDHFDIKNDMDNYVKYKLVGGRIKLKKGTVPHIFKCQQQKADEYKRSVLQKRRLKCQQVKEEKTEKSAEDKLPEVNYFETPSCNVDKPTTSIMAIEKVEEIFVNSYDDMIIKEEPLHPGYDTDCSTNACKMSLASSTVKSWKWDVSPLLVTRSDTKYAVIILNRPVSLRASFMRDFWNEATVRLTVDGGTVKWDTFVENLPDDEKRNVKPPDLVTGDFDSIKDEVMEKYKKIEGCQIIHTPNQMYTDFTKALIELSRHCQNNNIQLDHIVAIGQASGRLDQILGNIQTLFLATQKNILDDRTRLYIISDDNVVWLLQAGDHVINVPSESRSCRKPLCSLVPVGMPCQNVVTTGLKWNLENQPLKFGELISTSNTFDGSDVVTVKCSQPLLWSMRVAGLL